MSCLDITPPRYVGLRRTPNKRSWILKIETSAIHLKMNVFQHALRKTSTATQTTDRIPLNAHFSSKLRGDSRVCSLDASCFWHGYSSTRQVKRGSKKQGGSKKKKGGKFLIPHKMFRGNPTLPHLERKYCRWNIKFRALKCWEMKVEIWSAGNHTDWHVCQTTAQIWFQVCWRSLWILPSYFILWWNFPLEVFAQHFFVRVL